jgi:hypothetical protein
MEAKSIYNEKNHTLLVELPIAYMWHSGLEAKTMGFKEKEEFHITVIGHAAGKIISDSLKSNDRRKVLKDLFDKTVTEYEAAVLKEGQRDIPNDAEMRIIEKQYSDDDCRKSLVIMLERDEHTLRFHQKLDALFPGIIHHLSIPHVTIGVDGDHPGIGLTQQVWDNELTSNFLVASPSQVKHYKTKIQTLESKNHDLEYALHNQPSCSCHHCEHCDEWNECTGECQYR